MNCTVNAITMRIICENFAFDQVVSLARETGRGACSRLDSGRVVLDSHAKARVVRLVHSYRRSQGKQERANYWLNWFIAAQLISAVMWGMTIILFPPQGAIVHLGLTVLWVCGLTAGSVAALSSVKGAFFRLVSVS